MDTNEKIVEYFSSSDPDVVAIGIELFKAQGKEQIEKIVKAFSSTETGKFKSHDLGQHWFVTTLANLFDVPWTN